MKPAPYRYLVSLFLFVLFCHYLLVTTKIRLTSFVEIFSPQLLCLFHVVCCTLLIIVSMNRYFFFDLFSHFYCCGLLFERVYASIKMYNLSLLDVICAYMCSSHQKDMKIK